MKRIVSTSEISFYIPWVCYILTCLLPAFGFGQHGSASDIKLADQYFLQGSYAQAILSYRSYLSQHPQNISARVNLGIALLNLNRLKEAGMVWDSIISNNNTIPSEVYFLAGRTSHQLSDFSAAENYYRAYIRESNQPELRIISYYLEQTGAAATAGDAGSIFLVENAGSSVNSPLDEIRPVYSPNFGNRFYFTIHDPKPQASIRTASQAQSSIMSAGLDHGTWHMGGAMDDALRQYSRLNLLDFYKDGQQVLLMEQVAGAEGGKTYVKRFQSESGPSEWSHEVYNSSLGDRDLFIIHDSAYLFSSNRLKGYGGYDLFVTFKRLGKWMVQNLGSQINSRYDEIEPFLCPDGRGLYFSTNSNKSIGGYDIFFANFDDEMESWTTPVNLLPPLNSGMDDTGFRLSEDGRSAVFCSNRFGGFGGFDIYNVYFDHRKSRQIVPRKPRYFYQVEAYRSFVYDQHLGDSRGKPVFELPVVIYGTRPIVITSQLSAQLDKVVEYAKLFPHTGLILEVFSNQKATNDLEFYRPVLLLKPITDYLVKHGVDMTRIQERIYGDQYPLIVSNLFSGQGNPGIPPETINKRLEFRFDNSNNLPVQFIVSSVLSKEAEIKKSPYSNWKKRIQNQYFRIQLADSPQLFKGTNLSDENDFMMIVDGKGNRYKYFAGIFEYFDDALAQLNQYKSRGLSSAKIIAFQQGEQIQDDKISPAMIETWPELKKYIIYQK